MKPNSIIKKNFFIIFFILFSSASFANDIFVSLKKNKVNVRYGPSFDSDIIKSTKKNKI